MTRAIGTTFSLFLSMIPSVRAQNPNKETSESDSDHHHLTSFSFFKSSEIELIPPSSMQNQFSE
ncbi:unnamed protein product [Thlaspi arvense]|uniref:Uncharacterized protein n=1 Tax=Thlaspi arvense TaxID=13288 RepID=A0AAU9S238_THLAR|nr:unnamed protein product [Thlaspi arvense]